MEQRGSNEVGSLEDLEVALGGVVALGAVDDGLGRFVPGDLLSESVDGGDGTEFPVGQLESDAEGVAEGFGGGVLARNSSQPWWTSCQRGEARGRRGW
ncbi:MAG: hypothetical protein B9S38_06300 [Verrucomicrobiia bacterium Tous-C4TDCM]|nr:MAG: hypothetical protein B9S38_06300 [Verrucomicrobiae bacterium Tous-C4TDCM]